jgi:hypothetical protein
MSIWGRRDSEPPAEEAHEGQAEAHDAQAPAAEHQAGEPAPAFWRAQGETPASLSRDPADAPPPDYEHVPDNPPPAGVPATMGPTPAYGQQAPGEAPAPAASGDPAGSGVPAPALTGVVIDGENGVKDPGLMETPADHAGAHDAEPGGPEATGVPEPTVAVAREPVVTEAQEPAATEAQEPAATEAERQAVAPAPAVTGAQSGAHDSGITAQRWSEILAAFVDDPRGSVKMAADAVDEAFGDFVKSVRLHQRDLACTWQSAEADTEQLRTALREYRKLGHQIRQLDLGERTGA